MEDWNNACGIAEKGSFLNFRTPETVLHHLKNQICSLPVSLFYGEEQSDWQTPYLGEQHMAVKYTFTIMEVLRW